MLRASEFKAALLLKQGVEKMKSEPPVRSSELVRLRRTSKRSLKHWTLEMNRAAKDLRSGDERNARDSVVWIKGYLKALDDVEQSNHH